MSDITPKNATELFGHESVQAQWLHDFAAGKLAHGIIISGGRGIGKATLAYRFARMLLSGRNDFDLSSDDPIFHRISAGSHTDLLVIEREFDEKKEEFKNEISVEQARGIADFLSLTPAEGKWRVVIIDSADALNTNAANAILKILEEPPAQAILLLVSHNPGRLLPTIRSRCRMLKLAPLSAEDFTRTIRHVAPDTDYAELRGLQILSGGAPGVALELKEQGALAVYGELLETLSSLPAFETARIHRFADQLSGGKMHEHWHMLTRLMLCLLERTSKTAASVLLEEIIEGEQTALLKLASLHPAHIWAAKWQECADQFLLAQRLHLDYKQVMITFIHSIASIEGFNLGYAA